LKLSIFFLVLLYYYHQGFVELDLHISLLYVPSFITFKNMSQVKYTSSGTG
jgi:hypothetical protein